MSIRLSELTKETRKIQVHVGASEPLEVEHRIQAYTPEIEAELTGAENRPAGTLAKILCRLVASWTLEDDDGDMYPLDEEHAARLPLPFMMAVFAAIAEDMRPNPPKAGN